QHGMPSVGHIGKLRDIPVTQNTIDLIWPHCRIGHDRGSSRIGLCCASHYCDHRWLIGTGTTAPAPHAHRCSAAIVVKSRGKDNARCRQGKKAPHPSPLPVGEGKKGSSQVSHSEIAVL